MANEIAVRCRRDLEFFPRKTRGDHQCVVKDPVTCQNFLFSLQELELLKLFDGRRSYLQIRDTWREKHRSQSLTVDQVSQFAQRMLQDNLGVVEQFGLGRKYYQAGRATVARQRAAKWQSPLVIRLGGIDPTPLLEIFGWFGRILFNRFSIFCVFLLSFLLGGYLVSHAEEIGRQLPTLSEFFAAKNILLMTAVIVGIKILHEIGHGLACRRYGGECLEIGVILLAFIPTLYCDVSDAWTFRDRWKRIMVSFAGVYVEVILANIAAVIWLLTDQGLFNSLAFNVAIMCSLNTLFVNGNPLLRYDGYYMLSDWLERPNLSLQARHAVRKFVGSAWKDLEDQTPIDRGILVFGILSTIYRWFVLASIIFGVYFILQSFELGYLSEGIALLLLATMGIRMFTQYRMERRSVQGKINWFKTAAFLGACGLAGILFLWMPLPSHVYCRFEIEPADPGIVYAPRDGRLSIVREANQTVEKNELVATLEDPTALFDFEKAKSRLVYLEERRERINRQIDSGAGGESDLILIESEIQKQKSELNLLADEARKLNVTSTKAGTIQAVASVREDEPNRTVQPLLPQNNGCYVRRGQPLFSVIDDNLRVVGIVGEQNVEFLDVGQIVKIRFVQSSQRPLSARIAKIIDTDLELDEVQTERMGLEVKIDSEGKRTTVETPYRVVLEVDNVPDSALVGSTGYAKISIPAQSAAQKLGYLLDNWWNGLQ